eukprot:TRINITY_DN7504_c0_g1_i1.p1 TRINITY_DN7504_c0_g1~~TRINITY_DN7504_c0_g1_i1.p1  ORF type:complete len:637 (+),score=126.58 TRINITY_DN7504_c0_g1_i1:27-1913(+)
MVHTVFRALLLKDKLPHGKIEALASFENQVILGTNDGSILIYEAAPSAADAEGEMRYSVKARNCRPAAADRKKPITQIIPLPEIDMLLFLMDGMVMQYRLSTLMPKNPLKHVKFCSIFTVKKENGRFHLAAIARKKLYIFEYISAGEAEFDYRKDFQLPDQPKTLLWSGKHVCLGFAKEYTLLDVSSQAGNNIELFQTGRSKTPLSVTLDDASELMLAKDNIGISVDWNSGKPTRKFGTRFGQSTEMPIQLGFVAPYVVSLHLNFIEVHNPDKNEGLAQTIPLKFAERLSFPLTCDMDGYAPGTPPGLRDKGRNMVFVTTTTNSLYLLDFVPFTQQVQELADTKDFESALLLCGQINKRGFDPIIPKKDVQEIHLQNGYTLFARSRFKEAMEAFQHSQVDVRIVVSLYPDLLPKYVVDSWLATEPKSPVGPQVLAEEGQKMRALDAIIPYLNEMRNRNIDLVTSQPSDPLQNDTTGPGMIASTIDTALLKAYLATKEDQVKEFVRVPNRCVVDDCERALKKEQKWEEVVLFYQQKQLHRKALEILSKLGQEKEEQRFAAKGSGAGGASTSTFGGPKYTIEYLQRLNNAPNASAADLILKYCAPVLKAAHFTVSVKLFLPLTAEDCAAM